MAGVRIHHPTERSAVYVIVDGKRPYPVPLICPVCRTTHTFKTYHITVDALGFAIVSPEIVDRLRRIPTQPFTIENEVRNPPAQTVGFAPGPADGPPIIQHRE